MKRTEKSRGEQENNFVLNKPKEYKKNCETERNYSEPSIQ